MPEIYPFSLYNRFFPQNFLWPAFRNKYTKRETEYKSEREREGEKERERERERER